MIVLSDLLYFASVDPRLQHVIKQAYEADSEAFLQSLSFLFNVEQQKNLRQLVGLPAVDIPQQHSIDRVMQRICEVMHDRLSDEGRTFLHTKGITDDQIAYYKLGDSSWLDAHPKDVLSSLLKEYDREAVTTVWSCISQYQAAIADRYNSPAFLSYPSYANSEFSGVVFRTKAFEKREEQMRNMFKFYSPYNYSYLFNESALEEYDTINLVEGVSDALALIRLGYENTVSPSMVRLSPCHVEKLKGKRLNVLFDRDMGGYAGANYVIDKLGSEQLQTVALTPNGIDFDEEGADVIHSYMSRLSEYDIR